MASYIGKEPARQSIVSDDAITSAKIFDGTVAGADLASDITISTTGTITTSQVNLGDNEKIVLGTSGSDFDMFHQGSYTALRNFTGNLYLGAPSSGGAVAITNQTISTVSAEFDIDGAVDLYYNNSKKFETSNTGATVTGTLVADGVDLGDNEKIRLGASQDLEIYHDGSNTFIHDNGTGHLKIKSNEIRIIDVTNEANYMGRFVQSGAVELYYSGSKKIETTSAGATVTGDLTVSGEIQGNNYLRLTSPTDTETFSIRAEDTYSTFAVGNRTLNLVANRISLQDDAFTSRLYIQQDGTIGMGTTSPSTNLHISGTGTPSILIEDSDGTNQTVTVENSSGVLRLYARNDTSDGQLIFYGNGGGTATEKFRIDTNGKVGIGTASPTQALTVYSSSSAQIHLNTANPGIRFSSDTAGNSDTTRAFIGYATNNGGFISGSSAGDLVIRGNSTSSVLIGRPSGKIVEVTGSGVDVTGDLTVDTDTLYVDSSNNRVGIGTTSPLHPLQVDGVIYTQSYIQINSGQQIKFGNGNQYIEGTNDTSLELATGGSTSVIIDNSGQVGIGTVTPGYNLEVTGDAYVSTDLTIGGNLTVSGTTTTIDTTNTQVTDNLLELNSGATANTNDAGIIIERGSTGDNAIMAWDESADQFIFGTTTATASDTGNLTITAGDINVAGITTTSINLGDDEFIYQGDSNEFSIVHEGVTGNTYLRHTSAQPMYIRADKLRITNSGLTEYYINANNNGAVELFYDNTKKFETTSSGIQVTGSIVTSNSSGGSDVIINSATSSDSSIFFNDAGSNIYNIFKDGSQSDDFRMLSYTDTAGATDFLRYSINGSLRFSTAAAERMRISSAGLVGIGTSNPQYDLHIADTTPILALEDTDTNTVFALNASSTSGIIQYQTDVTSVGTNPEHWFKAQGRFLAKIHDNGDFSWYEDTGSSVKMFWEASTERLGIGNSNPAYNLDVHGDTGTLPRIRVHNTGTVASDSSILQLSIAGTTAESLIYFADGDDSNAGQLRYDHATDYLSIHTNAAEAMRIDSSGNILFGATSSSSSSYGAKFLKDGSTSEILAIHRQAADGDFIQFTRGSVDSGNIKHAGGNLVINAVNDFQIETNNGTNVVHVDSSGNVGIGTSSPNERLSVVAEDDTSSIDNGFSIYRSVGDDKVTINAQGGGAKFIADGGSGYIPYRFFGYDGTTLAERLTIDGSGNVGIGTSSPSTALDVVGTITASGTIESQAPTRHSIRPSLNLDFANSKALDPRITFIRGSNATYYDGYSSVKAEENLIKYSEEFDNSYWNKSRSSISANQTTAPDGTTTADELIEDTSTNNHRVYIVAHPVDTSKTYTQSVFVKANTRDGILMRTGTGGTDTNGVKFDIGTQTITDVGIGADSSSITDVGNGWYRCSMTFSPTANPFYPYIALLSGTGAVSYTGNGSSLYIWGFQFEERDSLTAYTPTTSSPITKYQPQLQTAGSNVARFDHDPITGESLGLLIEEQRTNLNTYSEILVINQGITKIDNTLIAPDGTLTAEKLQIDTSSGRHRGQFNSTFSVTAGNQYTYSAYVKIGSLAGSGIISLVEGSGALWVMANFDPSDNWSVGLTNATSANAVHVGNDWYRISFTHTRQDTGNARIQIAFNTSKNATSPQSFAGNGYDYVYVWGGQVEQGSFPTSYIKTTGSQATRSKDSVEMIGISDWFNFEQGTLYAEVKQNVERTNYTYFRLDDGGNGNFLFIGTKIQTYDAITIGSRLNGSTTLEVFGSTQGNTNNIKAVGTYSNTNLAISANGETATTGTGNPISPSLDRMEFGEVGTSNSAYFKRLAYYPVALTANEIQDLSEA